MSKLNRVHPTDDWDATIAQADRVVRRFAESANDIDASDREDMRTADGLRVLANEGLLAAPLRLDGAGAPEYAVPAHVALRVLTRLGGLDLSLGRLYEGHLNALQVISLYGSDRQRAALARDVRSRVLYGVWGADGTPSFCAEREGDAAYRLGGKKRYASGIGLVGTALVPYARDDAGMRMIVVPVDDPERMDRSTWSMRGMIGSRSGTYDFDGLVVGSDSVLGKPGDYQIEPYFVGGIWRCAAVQLGAIERLTSLMIKGLKSANRFEHPLQLARVGKAILASRTARLWIEDAALKVEAARTPPEIERAVSLSAYARLQTEAAGMTVIDLVECGIGLQSFSTSHPVEQLSRDLAVYLRQANPDAVLLEHARVLAAQMPDS